MIDFIKKSKSLKEVFEEAEDLFSKKDEALPEAVTEVEELETGRPFYQTLCDDFTADLKGAGIDYERSLISLNISFEGGETPVYTLSFPLIETSETQSHQFIKILKNSIKNIIGNMYQVNLSLKNEGEVHRIMLVLEEKTKGDRPRLGKQLEEA